MSFFKKLFNKIRGKDDAETPLDKGEVVASDVAADEPAARIEAKPKVKAEEKPKAQPGKAEKPKAAVKAKPQSEAKAPAIEKTKPQEKAKAKPEPKPKPVVAEKPKPEPVAKPVAKPEPKPEPIVAEKPKPESETKPEPKPEPVVTEKPKPESEAKPAPKPKPVVAEKPKPKPVVKPEVSEQRKGWFSKLRSGLSKSSNALTGGITSIFTKRKLDSETLQDLEDILIQADLGIDMAERVTKAVAKGRYDKEIDPEEVKRILADEVEQVLKPVEIPFTFDDKQQPFVILVVGVNGSGKTTTIGKLGSIATAEGFSVMLAACDTFRAAAIEQLQVWGERIGAPVIARPIGADSAGLAFDAMVESKTKKSDILIIDTAGRLQNKTDLMAELEKIVRVIKKQDATAPHAVLLVLDATTGQNAVGQTEVFSKVAGVTGLIMTKLDGTARGGILVAIAERFKLPVHAIGVGEGVDDLQAFDATGFARAIAGLEDEGEQ